jgi:predicted small metal-binding protein
MAYSVTCADAGGDCPGKFTTETKEELLEHLEVHVEASHPGLELGPEQVDALIKTS